MPMHELIAKEQESIVCYRARESNKHNPQANGFWSPKRTLPDLTKRDEQIFIPCWRSLPPGPDCVKVIHTATNHPEADLKDLGVLVFLAPGIWQQREWAKPLVDGLYEVSFIPR